MWRLNVCAAALLAGLLGGCSDTLSGPIDLFHDLEGGQIAAQRPPPPGAGLPYPNLGSVPAKPALPDPAFRNGLQAQLLAERDRTERLAADAPIQALPPPPPPPPPPPAAAQNTAAAQNGGVAPATATLDTVEAPARVQAPAAPAVPQPGITLVGGPADPAFAPDMPDTPPLPATFEGVSPEPSPTSGMVPNRQAAQSGGATVYFSIGDAALPPSQIQALKAFLVHRSHQPIVITGLGEAASDTPDGQAAALSLALQRARAVAAALRLLHVDPADMHLSAQAFGRGVVLRLAS